tara:strand:- start:54 stop:422 length:369 start_codon:yes stop_codon:yes gene_type:complete
MIIQRVTESQFIDAFKSWDTYKSNFSYEGLKALYEELEQVAECSDSGTFELDVVAICCDYTEFENFKEFQEQYSNLDIKHIFGGSKDCLDYWTSIVLPECWIGRDSNNTEEVKHLPFIIRQF